MDDAMGVYVGLEGLTCPACGGTDEVLVRVTDDAYLCPGCVLEADLCGEACGACGRPGGITVRMDDGTARCVECLLKLTYPGDREALAEPS